MKRATMRLMGVLLAGLLVGGLGGGLGVQIAYAQEGDLTTIDDPLAGEYELLTVDDLVVQGPAFGDDASTITNFILKTEDRAIAHQEEDHAIALDCAVTNGPGQNTRIGRFFALDRDVMVTLHPNVNASGDNCADTTGLENNMSFRIRALDEADFIGGRVLMSPQKVHMVAADFTQDGLDDLFVISDAEAFVATAVDVDDHTQGFKFGPFQAIESSLATSYDITAGDLNGDGFTDVAWIAQGNNINFATVCPGPVTGTVCENATALQVIVNPLAATATHVGNTPSCSTGLSDDASARAITIGRFTSDGQPSLVALYPNRPPGTCHLMADWYRFNPDFSLIGGGPVSTLQVGTGHGDVFAEAAPLFWFGGSDQVVVAYTTFVSTGCSGTAHRYQEHVGVITFAADTADSMAVAKTLGSFSDCMNTPNRPGYNVPWLNGLATGYFDSVPDAGFPDPQNYNLQIATLLNSRTLRIYTVDASAGYLPALLSEKSLTVHVPVRAGQIQNDWLHAGDLQGRGLHLGTPTVVRIPHHSQPNIILGHPPMHADYILPAHSTALEPEIINFSVIPETYYARFKLSSSSETQSTTSETSSYAYGMAWSVQETFKVNVPLVSKIKGSFKQAWTDKSSRTKEKIETTQTSTEYNVSSTTTLGDQIWFTESGFNLYIYPVLGHTVCPAELPECTEAEEEPLVMMFSGPNSTTVLSANGATTEWYQPVHQPGQIFSYPWNQQQLEARSSGDLEVLSQVASFLTDDSDLEQEVSWSGSNEVEKSVGTKNSHSFKTDNSLTFGKIPKVGAGMAVKGSFSYNTSSATESLNSSTTTVGASSGIEIAMPGTFLSPPQYKYLVQGTIFGQAPSAGSVQEIEQSQDLTTAGPLHTAFIADPTSANAGSWWTSDASPYTQYVDLALNHPARWEWEISTNANSADDLRCLFAEASKRNCVSVAEPDPTDIWNSPFYWMRGLLITVDDIGGPQRNYATAGDHVYLQARVYNYSLKDMDPSHKIRVRFYRQRIQGTTPVGDSVLIADQTVNPLPGFNSKPDTPNWTTVATFFDTTDLANQYFIFWVVVWLEDASGNMVAELPGHGLAAAPGTLTSLTDVELEEVTLGSGEEEETLSFSNNVGFFHSKFYVSAVDVEAADAASAQPATLLSKELHIENVALSAHQVELGENVIFSADVVAKGAEVDGVSVRVYHVVPGGERALLDHETLPHIPAGGSDVVSVPYRPRTAGIHEFIIVAARPGAIEGIGHATLLVSEPEIVDQSALYLPMISHE